MPAVDETRQHKSPLARRTTGFIGQAQGAPRVPAGFRCLTSDPGCRPAKGRLTGQETHMRRLALVLAAGHHRPADHDEIPCRPVEIFRQPVGA